MNQRESESVKMTLEQAIKSLSAYIDNEAYTDKFQSVCKLAIESLEKQIPKKLVCGYDEDMICPKCSAFICWEHNLKSELHQQTKYCEFCGQAIKLGKGKKVNG